MRVSDWSSDVFSSDRCRIDLPEDTLRDTLTNEVLEDLILVAVETPDRVLPLREEFDDAVTIDADLHHIAHLLIKGDVDVEPGIDRLGCISIVLTVPDRKSTRLNSSQ